MKPAEESTNGNDAASEESEQLIEPIKIITSEMESEESTEPEKPGFFARLKFRCSLKVGLAATILVTVIVTSALIFFPWIYISKKNTANIALELNREIIKGVVQEINNVFTTAESTLLTIDGIFSQGIVSVEDQDQRQQLYLALLKSNPTFSWISFGWPNGDFIGAQRQDDKTIRFINSTWNPAEKKAKRVISYYLEEKNRLSPDVIRVMENKYYAPQRGWFKKAVDTQGKIWTGVYVFATSKKPGINVAISHEPNNNFAGVITIAIELERISNYLSTINVGKTGTVFIMNSKQELIAFQNPEEVTHTIIGKGKPQLKALGKANDPRLLVAYNAMLENKQENSGIEGQSQIYYKDTVTGENYFISFSPIEKRGWTVGTIIPESDFLSEINANMQKMLIAVFALILVAAFVVVTLSRYLIVNPLLKITHQTRQIQNFELDQIEYIPSVIQEVDQLSTSMEQMRKGLDSFQRYLPTELVRKLISQGIEAKLGGEEKSLSVYFIDLVDFTKISEAMGPDLIPYLAQFMGEMSHIITRENGTIDKYMGDAIMAFWGAPTPNDNHALDACRTALQCQRTLNSLRIIWRREGKTPFMARIGINTGPVLVGNMGSDQKMDYTVIGDTVNVASRLEALNKMYGTNIIIGEGTFHEVRQEVIVRKLDNVVVYGREQGLDIYEVITMRDDLRLSTKLDHIQVYEEGLKFYQNANFGKAIEKFERTIELRGGKDNPSNLLIRRCQRFIEQAPDANFSGTTIMRKK